MFRPIRMDHTNCLQVAIKSIQFNSIVFGYIEVSYELGIPIDSGIVLSITIDKFRVFITKKRYQLRVLSTNY